MQILPQAVTIRKSSARLDTVRFLSFGYPAGRYPHARYSHARFGLARFGLARFDFARFAARPFDFQSRPSGWWSVVVRRAPR